MNARPQPPRRHFFRHRAPLAFALALAFAIRASGQLISVPSSSPVPSNAVPPLTPDPTPARSGVRMALGSYPVAVSAEALDLAVKASTRGVPGGLAQLQAAGLIRYLPRGTIVKERPVGFLGTVRRIEPLGTGETFYTVMEEIVDAERLEPPARKATPVNPAPVATRAAGSNRTAPAGPAPGPVAYTVVKRWLFAGGEGKRIVIAPNLATVPGLTALGRQLADEHAGSERGMTIVFTDAKAAATQERLNDATAEERAFLQRHFVGRYQKNNVAGVNDFELMPQGLNGPTQTVKY